MIEVACVVKRKKTRVLLASVNEYCLGVPKTTLFDFLETDRQDCPEEEVLVVAISAQIKVVDSRSKIMRADT